jgi:outer membrane receptor for ferrienterochelin and colicins
MRPGCAPRIEVAALVLAAAGQMPSLPVRAQEPSDDQEAQRVEIRARPPDEEEIRRRDPVATTVYGRAELDRYGDTRLSDVLARLPGLSIQDGSPRLRGLGNGYTQLLVNGEPPPPGFSLDEMAPDQVDRVEVTKAPSADHSTQAIAGTVNIVLRQPPRQRQRDLRLALTRVGTAPTGSASLTLGDRSGDLSFASPLSLYQWEWNRASVTDRVARDLAGDPQQLHVDGQAGGRGQGVNWGPRLAWQPDRADRFNALFFIQRARSRYRGDFATEVLEGLPPPSVVDREVNQTHWRFQRLTLSWQRKTPEGSQLDARIGGQSSVAAFDNLVTGWDAAGVNTVERRNVGDAREHSASGAAKLALPLGETGTVSGGVEFELRQRREQRSVTNFGLPQIVGIDGEPFSARIDRTATFAQAEWRPAAGLAGYLGLRGERLATVSAGPADSLAQASTVVSPLLHLAWRSDPASPAQWRASLTRSYRAPSPNALLARPSVNPNYPLDGPNPVSEPDRVGNPALRPELATGIDLAWERPFGDSGSVTIGGFVRRIHATIRTAVTLETVPWASAPRWVQQPVNLGAATSQGIEFELKGRAAALMPGLPDRAPAIDLRLAGNLYRSQVDGVPGPDNRIEGQPDQSWSLGWDHRLRTHPWTWGASLAWTPGYATQLDADRRTETGRDLRIDAYALWRIDPRSSLRFAAGNLWPLEARSRTTAIDAGGLVQGDSIRRETRTRWSMTLDCKL